MAIMAAVGTLTLADLYGLDPVDFEHLVGKVFSALGYDVTVTKRSGDGGVDLELRRGDERSIAQCKRYRGTVGQPDLRDFFGTLVHENATRGYFVTSGQFSLAASTWAQGKPLSLVDGVDLVAALENSGVELAASLGMPNTAVAASVPFESIVSAAAAPILTAQGALLQGKIGAAEFRASMALTAGRILLDGPPPPGRTYCEVANLLEQHSPGFTSYVTSSKLKLASGFDAWIRQSQGFTRFIDEFDALPRATMESILDLSISASERSEDYAAGSIEGPFVVVASAWEKRLPMAVRVRFSTVISARDLDWGQFEGIEARSPDAIERYNEQRELRQNVLPIIQALVSDGDPLRGWVKQELARLDPGERLIVEMCWGLKDGQRRELDAAGAALGLTQVEAAMLQSSALENLARRRRAGQ